MTTLDDNVTHTSSKLQTTVSLLGYSEERSLEDSLLVKGEWKIDDGDAPLQGADSSTPVAANDKLEITMEDAFLKDADSSTSGDADEPLAATNGENNSKTIHFAETNFDHDQPSDEVWSRSTVRRIRRAAGSIVESIRFQQFIVVMILINSAMMGIATFDFVQNNPDAVAAFEITDKVFLIIFTLELGLQLIYRDVKLFLDGWLVFDFCIVVMSWALESFQIVRTLRIFRALRLVTRVKLLKNLVSALFSVGPRIFAIFCLLVLVFYIYAVMCTELFKYLYRDGFTDNDYFSTLDRSVWTLFTMMTLEWAAVTRQVMDVYEWAWPIFITFLMVTSFIAYNLIVAVVCDSVSIIERQSKEQELLEESAGVSELESDLSRMRRLHARLSELSKLQQHVLRTLEGTDENVDKVLELDSKGSQHGDYDICLELDSTISQHGASDRDEIDVPLEVDLKSSLLGASDDDDVPLDAGQPTKLD